MASKPPKEPKNVSPEMCPLSPKGALSANPFFETSAIIGSSLVASDFRFCGPHSGGKQHLLKCASST